MHDQTLSVIVPAFNEQATIREVVLRVLDQAFVEQVVVVDDGSTDETGAIARSIDDPRLLVIQQETNLGKGAAIRRGLQHCIGEFVAIQDADLEYDPSELERLLSPLVSGAADAVFGSRFASTGERRALYYWHTVGNKALTLLSNMVSNINLTDMETGYKAFRRDALSRLRLQEDGFGIEPEFAIKAALNNLRIFEVGISYQGRTYEDGKKVGWKDGIEAIWCIGRFAITERQRIKRERRVLGQSLQPELHGSLEGLRDIRNYYEWIYSLGAPFLGDRVLEVGAGVGTFTEYLARHARTVVAVEPEQELFDELQAMTADVASVTCMNCTSRELGPEDHRQFDSAVLINVLEHIGDDVSELRHLSRLVRHGGFILLWVPSHAWLYSEFDAAIGHFRRYSHKELKAVVESSGLEIVDSRYVNPLGAVGWFVTAKLLGSPPTKPRAAKAFDRYAIPWMRALNSRFAAPFGQSLWLVARVPEGG